MPHKLRSLQSSWQEQTLFLALSVSSTLSSNLFELFFPWTQGVSLSLCAALSSLVLCLENFTCLGLSRVSSIPSTPGIWWNPHGSLSLPCILESLSMQWAGAIIGSFHLFPISQGSLPFFTWYPVSWLPLSDFGLFPVLFFGFWFIFFLDVSSKRVNTVPVTPSWPEKQPFLSMYIHIHTFWDYMHQNIKRIYLWVVVL